MVTIGVDPHKASHTLVAVDEVGRKLAVKTVAAHSAGVLEAMRWVKQWPERVWALENCRHLIRRLERQLLVAGEAVKHVPSRQMAEKRKQGRERGKSDPIDALAVARACLREPGLPTAQLEGRSREIRLLVDHREDLVGTRSQMENRFRWHLHELDEDCLVAAGALSRVRTVDKLQAKLAHHCGLVADLAREVLAGIRELTVRINQLEQQLSELVRPMAPTLLALQGCAVLTTAKVMGEVGSISRFHSRSSFARHNGSAPIPVWSGDDTHHRLNPGGNRQLNAALHRIALTQSRSGGAGRAYLDRRRQAGDTTKEAMRALKRRISDEVYRCLQADERLRAASQQIPNAPAA